MPIQREPSLLRFKPSDLRALLAVALFWSPVTLRAQEGSGASGGEQEQQGPAGADQGDAGGSPSGEREPTQPAPDGSPTDAEAAAPAQAAPALSPPELLEQVEPEYPQEELAEAREVSVVLRLSIDAQGNVVDAEVLESAGPAFDEAALAAARKFRFVPAKRHGTPIPARIPVRIAFRPPQADEETEPAPELAPVGASPEAPAPSAQAPSLPSPVEVQVHGQLSRIEQRRKSADTVTVVDLEQARRRSADLGEVLARAPGVTVRRYGGLGSPFRFSINGLDEHAVRIFVDGVPIDRVYAMNAASIPVNLVDHVEVYRGVVPLRLGADALGGAVNLVRPSKYETGGQASYSVGSFGTHRVAATGRYRHDRTGAVAGVDAFFDHADNDYFVDVEVPDEHHRPQHARVRRFHDAYQAYGVAVEAGVVEQAWARKLIARAFTSAYDKEIQHNIVMSVPYGEPKLGERVYGGLLTYENTFAKRYDLELIGSYAHHTIDFVDKGKWVYNWYGERVRERRVPGETDTRARDNTTWEHAVFGRANLDMRLLPGHQLTATFSPYYATRTGDERIQADPNARDPLKAERDLFKAVAGLGYTLSLLPLARAPEGPEHRRPEHYRIENTAFVKGYLYRVNSEDPLPGNVFRERDQSRNRLGAGNALRVTLVEDWLLAKASYEYATRLPETYEVFGDGMLIQANLELQPEISHNANLGPQLDLRRTKAGDFWLDLNLVLRKSENRIILLGNDRSYTYQNVYGARVLGIEMGAKWTSPGRYVSLDGQFTYNDQRNTSSQGTFGAYKGDRLPNTPYLTTSWGSTLHFEDVLFQSDSLEPFYQGRFVGEYFRAWESQGLKESKQTIPRQVSHSVGITYSKRIRRGHLYGTFEVQNLTDARLYDLFGAQRPGRGYYFKLTGDI